MILGDGHTRGPAYWTDEQPVTLENSLDVIINHRDGMLCPACPTGSLCPRYVAATMARLDAGLPIGSTTEETG